MLELIQSFFKKEVFVLSPASLSFMILKSLFSVDTKKLRFRLTRWDRFLGKLGDRSSSSAPCGPAFSCAGADLLCLSYALRGERPSSEMRTCWGPYSDTDVFHAGCLCVWGVRHECQHQNHQRITLDLQPGTNFLFHWWWILRMKDLRFWRLYKWWVRNKQADVYL